MTSCSEKEGDHFPLLILQSHWLLDLSSLIDPRLNPEPTNLAALGQNQFRPCFTLTLVPESSPAVPCFKCGSYSKRG